MRYNRTHLIPILALSLAAVASARDIRVGPSDNADFHTIQAGVNAAQPGDHIHVMRGTYNEQVDIPSSKNNVTIQGEHAVIMPPAGMTSGFLVTIDGATNVELANLTISGPLPDAAFSSGSATGGIDVTAGGSGRIHNNYITQIWQVTAANRGIQNGISILVGRQSQQTTGSADIDNNTLDHWQKGAIVIDNSGSSAHIHNNTVTGEGPINYTAQNGIQVSDGATGEVDNNDVSALSYTPGTYGSSGILIYETSNVNVHNNHIKGADLGVAFADVTASTISNNQISNGLYGIDVDEFFTGSQNNTIDHNHSNNNSQEGVFVSVQSVNNLFKQNEFMHNAYLDAEDDSVGTGTAGTGNLWTHNHIGTDNKGGGLGS